MERLDLDATHYSPSELAIHAARYLPLRDLVRGKRVLDIACGEGLGATLMIEQFGARQVVGVDISREAITKARAANTKDALVFVVSDAVAFLSRESLGRFDVVTCVETIEHLPDPEAFLSLIKHAVRGSGLVYISCPNDHWYYGEGHSANPFHVQKYSFTDFFETAAVYLGEPAHRFCGSVLAGFASYPVPIETASNFHAAAKSVNTSGFSLLVPAALAAKADAELTMDNSLYFAGLWNLGEKPVIARPGIVGWPVGASYRQPSITSLPRAVQQHGAATRMIVMHGPKGDSLAAAEAVRRALQDRLTIQLAQIESNDASTIVTAFNAQPHQFLHCVDVATADALYNGLTAAVAGRSEIEAFAWKIARPVWTFGALANQSEQVSFWQYPAYLFDGYIVADDQSCATDPLVHKARPEVLASDGTNLVQSWLRLLRRAEQAAESGNHSIRYAEVLRQFRALDAKPKRKSSTAARPRSTTTRAKSPGKA